MSARELPVAHFYHCFAAGAWEQPVSEHLSALTEAGFDGPLTLGVIGAPERRLLVRRIFEAVYPQTRTIEADSGFEQPTVRAAREYALDHDGAIMYAHTKGAAHFSQLNPPWRQAMTMHVVSRWRENARILAGPWVDAIGCHWLIPEAWTDRPDWQTPFFAGNFWIARCDYLRRLPPVADGDRGHAERWIGLGRPSVLNLIHDRPGMDVDIPPVQVGRLQVEIDGTLQPQL